MVPIVSAVVALDRARLANRAAGSVVVVVVAANKNYRVDDWFVAHFDIVVMDIVVVVVVDDMVEIDN